MNLKEIIVFLKKKMIGRIFKGRDIFDSIFLFKIINIKEINSDNFNVNVSLIRKVIPNWCVINQDIIDLRKKDIRFYKTEKENFHYHSPFCRILVETLREK